MFKSDPLDDEMAHIWARHRKTEQDAIRIFFGATISEWDKTHQRFESRTDDEGLQWFWIYEPKRVVMVTSCFNLREEEKEI